MKTHTKLAFSIVVIGSLAILAYRFVLPMINNSNQVSSSDSRNLKGTIKIGVDNWIGYYPLCSKELKKRMRRSGYLLQCIDDQADYDSRIKSLKKGKLQFAVATIDSYLSNAYAYDFPGTIVTVIDESKGGDAIIARKNRISSLDDIKKNTSIKIALTPGSPSEHLMRSIAVHFDIPSIRNNKSWLVEANGSEQALKMLQNNKVDIAVLWEPDVTRALEDKTLIKLIGTEDTRKLIVDILLVNRQYSSENSGAVNTLLRNYFRTLKYYRDNPAKLEQDAANEIKLSKNKIRAMLKGVEWKSLTDNVIDWFGAASNVTGSNEGLITSIENTLDIFEQNGVTGKNVLPGNDPYRLINSTFIKNLFNKTINQPRSGKTKLKQTFTALTSQQWAQLREIGTLKILPVVFQSGSANLGFEGSRQLDKAISNLKYYPNYRVIIKGHTGTRGDKIANLALSRKRAEAVSRYLRDTQNIDQNRLHFQGFGSTKPLPRKSGESNRAWQYRLPRVELYLVTDNY